MARTEESYQAALVLDPDKQPLSEEVQCPAHNGSDELGHFGAQGLRGVGRLHWVSPVPTLLEKEVSSLSITPWPL